jgi:hypothetical protein
MLQTRVVLGLVLLGGSILVPGNRSVNLSPPQLSSLVRNVPLFTALEVSPFFALLLSLGPPPERSPAPRFERRV